MTSRKFTSCINLNRFSHRLVLLTRSPSANSSYQCDITSMCGD